MGLCSDDPSPLAMTIVFVAAPWKMFARLLVFCQNSDKKWPNLRTINRLARFEGSLPLMAAAADDLWTLGQKCVTRRLSSHWLVDLNVSHSLLSFILIDLAGLPNSTDLYFWCLFVFVYVNKQIQKTFGFYLIFYPPATSNLVPGWLHLFPAFNYSDLISAQSSPTNHSQPIQTVFPHHNWLRYDNDGHFSFIEKNSIYISMTSAFVSFTNNNTLN